jgi:hypothetical protein
MQLSPTRRRLLFYGGLSALLVGGLFYCIAMPGRSYEGPAQAKTDDVATLAARLQQHVVMLSHTIGERRLGNGRSLARARQYIEAQLRQMAASQAARLHLENLGPEAPGAANVIFELPGSSTKFLIVGAHYDTAPGTPGANDNASGVAATLALAQRFVGAPLHHSLRFVLFANEEPPYFQNPGMGSLVHATGCRRRDERIVAMLALESLGYYSELPQSQAYPWPIALFYPETGNFLGFVGNLGSRNLVRQAIDSFRRSTPFPSQGAALPAWLPGVGWSDHWAFWQSGYPAIMVTDTAVFRDPHYHQEHDTPQRLDYVKLAQVTLGLEQVIKELGTVRE